MAGVRGELTEPFGTLLAPTERELVARPQRRPEPDWQRGAACLAHCAGGTCPAGVRTSTDRADVNPRAVGRSRRA